MIPVADILVLAGDIGYIGHESYELHPFWDWVSNNFRQVVVVPGNHEFYGGWDLNNLHNGMQVYIRDNVQWYYNSVIMIDGTEFILSPLFSTIQPDAKAIITSRLADFTHIEQDSERLTVEGYNKLHAECRAFLETVFATPKTDRRVVVTHHAPSFKCVHPDFVGSILNCAFYNDMDNLIEKSGADYWIYGHSHRNTGEVKIGDTTLLSNQLGYVHLKENRSFGSSMRIF